MNDHHGRPVVPAQTEIIALFEKDTQGVDKCASVEHESRPVVAFAADGGPLVIETDGSRDSRYLVRADSDASFCGMTYNASIYDSTSSRDENQNRRLTDWEIAAVDFVALRALELAGKRQLTRATRTYRHDLRDVPTWEIHAHMKIVNVDKALYGAYDLLYMSMPGQDEAFRVIDEYVRERISTQRLHDNRKLLAMLAEAGLPRRGD